MGFWSTLGKIGGAVAAPFTGGASLLPALIAGGVGVGGALLAKKASKPIGNPLTPLQASPYDEPAKKSLGQASDYYSKILGSPEGLAEATATTASDQGKALQRQTNAVARNQNRGGASSYALAEAPGQAESEAGRTRVLARMGAANQQGQLGLGMGELGQGDKRLQLGYQGLQLQNKGLDIQQNQYNSQMWNDLGQSIGGILTQPGAIGQGSILGRIFGGNKASNPSGSVFGTPPFLGTTIQSPSQSASVFGNAPVPGYQTDLLGNMSLKF